jgi:hypothetical protein
MAKIKVDLTDTFEEWRVKTNEAGSGIGRLDALARNSVFVGTVQVTGENEDSFQGTPATFKINNGKTAYTANVMFGGTGYVVGDIIVVKGNETGGVDGADPHHDVTITVLTVNSGVIQTVSATGTVPPDIVDEINQIRSDISGGGSTPTTPLTTTAQTLAGGINELDALQGNVNILGAKTANLPKTTFADITDAVKKIDDFQGNVVLPTTAQTVSGALAEHEAEIGTVSALTTTSKVVVGAIDELKVTADDAQSEIGGNMDPDYNGSETTIIAALNTLRSAGSTATLDQTYVKRNGTLDMTGVFQLDELGVKVSPNTKAMLFKTGTSDAIRMSIETNGRIGVGKTGAAVAFLFDVAGDLAATKLRYGTEDTDTRYVKAAISTIQTVSSPVKFTGAVEFTDVTKITPSINDIVGDMMNDSVENGLTVSYHSADGNIHFDVNDPTIQLSGMIVGQQTMTNLGSINIATTFSSDMTESIQDIVGAMIDPSGTDASSQTGLVVFYDDPNGKLDFTLTADPKIILGGDLSGDVTITNLATGNYTLNATINADSIALGTDTTGNYVSSVTSSGNGLSVSNTGTEGGVYTVNSNATSASTANTIVFRDGSKNFSCNVMTGTATQAQYADLAENYLADAEYGVGEIVSIGGDAEVTTPTEENDYRVLGVVSENPAYLMNSDLEGDHVCTVALGGRVPVKVIGRVCRGDGIVSAGHDGLGKMNNMAYPNTIIGKSLEDTPYDPDIMPYEDYDCAINTIEVVIM